MSQQQRALPSTDTNFLLTCSDATLATYEMMKLQGVANLRAELHEVLDQLIDATSQAALARWFRSKDRAELKRELENPIDVVAMAKEQIRNLGRSDEEVEGELEEALSLNPGLAHKTAAVTYQKRNIAEGKCMTCPKPLAPGSVRYCEKHLRDARLRYKPIGSAAPGSSAYLYADAEQLESRHGRQPGTLASLAMNREKKTRALLAELGIEPDNAAVSLKAAKEALLKVMPEMKGLAKTQAELFAAAGVTTETTGQKALKELRKDGTIKRVGKGVRNDPFRYFSTDGAKTP